MDPSAWLQHFIYSLHIYTKYEILFYSTEVIQLSLYLLRIIVLGQKLNL